MARPPLLTNEQILARARPVFRDHGYTAGTKEIAAAVGLTWGAIALRFGDKETLFRQATDMRASVPAFDRKLDGAAGLPGLLQELLAHLWETWPLRLQCRAAAAIPAIPDEHPQGRADGPPRPPRGDPPRPPRGNEKSWGGPAPSLEPRSLALSLASALGALAARGAIRRDMSPRVLAELVLSLATGEVVQRFVARERALVPNPAFINGVSRLLAGARPPNTSERRVSAGFRLSQPQRPLNRPAEGS